jgi:hypothetical protein
MPVHNRVKAIAAVSATRSRSFIYHKAQMSGLDGDKPPENLFSWIAIFYNTKYSPILPGAGIFFGVFCLQCVLFYLSETGRNRGIR